MGLVEHAKYELTSAGLFKKDSDYGGMLGKDVLELVKVFAKQGHSGLSANMAVSLFEKVALFEPLTPLTGEDNEWDEVQPGVLQNKRCSHVFSEEGRPYDIHGRVFIGQTGVGYINSDSGVPIIFPYTPKTEYVKET